MGVECGGSNVQMATDPETGEMVIIEMNPRVSRLERVYGLARHVFGIAHVRVGSLDETFPSSHGLMVL